MKNAFICLVIGISTLSLCSTAFTEEAPQALDQDTTPEQALTHQDAESRQSVEENLPEDTVKNTPKKKKPTKKNRQENHKTDKKKNPKKAKKHKKNQSKQRKKTPAIKEEETQMKDLPSSSQALEKGLNSESPVNSIEENN